MILSAQSVLATDVNVVLDAYNLVERDELFRRCCRLRVFEICSRFALAVYFPS